MIVYLLWDNSSFRPQLAGIFSSKNKAEAWLEKQNSWTLGEKEAATIESWFVDWECD